MPNRVASLLLTGFLLAAAAPNANTAATNSTTYAPRQQPALKLEQTRTQQAWGEVLTLQGQYQGAGGSVSLRSTVTKTGAGTAKTPPPGGYAEIDPEQPGDGDPGAGYYYSYSEITHSDGRPLAQAAYEYEGVANKSMLYITLGGVTLTFDLYTQQPSPVSDAEQERLNAWAQSHDALLVDQASVGIIQEGRQQAEAELLLNYYAIAMLVDPAEGVPVEDDGVSSTDGKGRRTVGKGGEVLFVKAGGARQDLRRTCKPTLSNSFVGFGAGLSSVSRSPASAALFARQSCFGCCGWGCFCVDWGNPCVAHDACTLRHRSRLARQCMGDFIVAAVYVWSRYRRVMGG